MSNPLDPMIETLKAAEPRPEAVNRAVAAVRPSRRRFVPFAVGVTTLSLFVLWPRGESGVAWAQVVAQPAPPRYVLHRAVLRNGRPRPWITVWHDGPAGAHRVREVATVARSYPAMETIHSRAGRYVRRYGDYATFARNAGPLPREDANFLQIEGLLRPGGSHQIAVERSVATRVGVADRYRVELTAMRFDPATKGLREVGKERFFAYVSPGTTRILGWDRDFAAPFTQSTQITVEYPDRIPAGIFAIPRPRGLRVYDLDRIQTLASRVLKSRSLLVVQDANRRVWAFATKGSPTILGADSKERVWTLADYNGMGHYGHRSPYRATGIRLPRQVAHVDLRLAGRLLTAVPVLAIDNLETLAKEIKLAPLPLR